MAFIKKVFLVVLPIFLLVCVWIFHLDAAAEKTVRDTDLPIAKIRTLLLEGREDADQLTLVPTKLVPLWGGLDEIVGEYIEFHLKDQGFLGYVFRDLKTNRIMQYGFHHPYLDHLIEKSGLNSVELQEGKVYFAGPFELYIQSKHGEIYNLLPESGVWPEIITEKELIEVFKWRAEKQKNRESAGDPTVYTANNFKALSVSMKPCTTNDFLNLKITDSKGRRVYPHDHCAPTAATNAMMYLSQLGKSKVSSNYSNSDLFAKFYAAMDTNGGVSGNSDSGTPRVNIAPSYVRVGTEVSAPVKEARLIGTSMKEMIRAINEEKVLHLSVNRYQTTSGGHSIVAISCGDNYLIVANGWDSEFVRVDYKEIEVAQAVAVGY